MTRGSGCLHILLSAVAKWQDGYVRVPDAMFVSQEGKVCTGQVQLQPGGKALGSFVLFLGQENVKEEQ